MSLLTYEQIRPWARAIKEAVLTKRMPPWYADPRYGHFANDPTLPEDEIQTITSWVDAGAPRGNPENAPKPVDFIEGWNIGEPDVVIELPQEQQIPAEGTLDYRYVAISGQFPEDRWVQRAEIRPGNREVVHHAIAFVRPTKPSPAMSRREVVNTSTDPKTAPDKEKPESEFLVGFAPGFSPKILEPGRAKFVPAGSQIVLQLHYTTSGKATADRTRVGLIFAKEPPKQRVVAILAGNRDFVIPAGAPAYPLHSYAEFKQDAYLLNFLVHMHYRGKDFQFRAVFPDGNERVLLRVPNYDFNWQLTYKLSEPLFLPAGTRIECVAHYDNSPNNAANPDPTRDVGWGEQSWDEMMSGWMDIAFDTKIVTQKHDSGASKDTAASRD